MITELRCPPPFHGMEWSYEVHGRIGENARIHQLQVFGDRHRCAKHVKNIALQVHTRSHLIKDTWFSNPVNIEQYLRLMA